MKSFLVSFFFLIFLLEALINGLILRILIHTAWWTDQIICYISLWKLISFSLLVVKCNNYTTTHAWEMISTLLHFWRSWSWTARSFTDTVESIILSPIPISRLRRFTSLRHSFRHLDSCTLQTFIIFCLYRDNQLLSCFIGLITNLVDQQTPWRTLNANLLHFPDRNYNHYSLKPWSHATHTVKHQLENTRICSLLRLSIVIETLQPHYTYIHTMPIPVHQRHRCSMIQGSP